VYKRDYAFRMNVMEEIFDIIRQNFYTSSNLKVDTANEYKCSTVNRELQGIHIGGSSSCRR